MTRTEHWKHQPRAAGRFVTAERTETTTRTVTERLTVSEPAAPGVPGDPSPVFTRLLTDAQWDPGFAAWLAGRPEPAVLPAAVTSAAPAPAVPLTVIEVPRVPYPPLEEATLAHEFTDADRERLELTLGPSEYLP